MQDLGQGWVYRPTSGNALITELEQPVPEELASVNRNLLYVPGATVLSLDDDHQIMRSRAVTQLANLSHVKNPKKALGPVTHALCSALNPVFLVSNYSSPKEQIIHVWKRLVQLLQGVTTVGSAMPMCDAIFSSDRGHRERFSG